MIYARDLQHIDINKCCYLSIIALKVHWSFFFLGLPHIPSPNITLPLSRPFPVSPLLHIPGSPDSICQEEIEIFWFLIIQCNLTLP